MGYLKFAVGHITLVLAMNVMQSLRSTAFQFRAGNKRFKPQYGNVIETILDSGRYHSYLRPEMNDEKPLDVSVMMSVKSLDKISEDDMEYRITFVLYQSWRDHRLSRKDWHQYSKVLTMDGSFSDRIWVPDTYIVNSHMSFIHDVTTRNGLIQLFPNGTVLYVLKITSKVSCSMKLRKYPMDDQVCKLILASWSCTDKDLIYSWKKRKTCDPGEGSVEGMNKVTPPEFNITRCSIYELSQTTLLGNYSQLIIEFRLKRNVTFFLMQTYMPSILLVVLSWISFWINHGAVPARVGLGATTVLAMTTLLVGVYNRGPKSTSDIKAIDLYVCVCHAFVFAALVEYAGIHCSLRKCTKDAKKLSNRLTKMHQVYEKDKPIVENMTKPKFDDKLDHEKLMEQWGVVIDCLPKDPLDEIPGNKSDQKKGQVDLNEKKKKLKRLATLLKRVARTERVDDCSKILFPSLFVAFNIAYWSLFVLAD